MVNGNRIEYIRAYSEINCLLKYFPKDYIKKLPSKLLNIIQSKSNEKYNIVVDLKKDLQNQNISKKTKDILVVLKYNYWSNEKEKEKLKQRFYQNEKIFQENLSEKYKVDNLFNNSISNNKMEIASNNSIIEYKESCFFKLLNRLKKIMSKGK